MSGIEVCEPMRRLREELDRRGVEWEDASYVTDNVHHEQTLVTHRDGHEMSVVWSYMASNVADGSRWPASYGWPDLLECRKHRGDPIEDPVEMTVEECLEACCDD